MLDKPDKQITVTEPGVYFGMPEAIYHAAPALSSSGIKDILASPLTYWGRYLDPERVDDDATNGKTVGSALHKRLLEPAAYDDAYATIPDPADYPEAINGGADLRARCKDLSLAQSGTLFEMAARISKADPNAVLWPAIVAKFEAENEGKEKLKPDTAAAIELAAGFISGHNDARRALVGGWHEVSIFWTDKETGVPMKSRLDSLKPRAVVDLKSFSNSNRRPVDQAIARAVTTARCDGDSWSGSMSDERGRAFILPSPPPTGPAHHRAFYRQSWSDRRRRYRPRNHQATALAGATVFQLHG